MGKSITAFNKGISSALESLKERGDVSPLVAEELRTTVESIKTKIERQKKLDREIEQLARGCKNYENFLKTPGVGPFTAAMLCVLLCDPDIFANGRKFDCLHRTGTKKPRLRRQILCYQHTVEIQLRQRVQGSIC